MVCEFFPEMDSIKQELGHLLDEAQNSPPAGISDGTINEIQFNQLRDIHDALQKLLVAQLFNLQPDRRSIWARKEARRR